MRGGKNMSIFTTWMPERGSRKMRSFCQWVEVVSWHSQLGQRPSLQVVAQVAAISVERTTANMMDTCQML